jgi:hypothetical protein
MVPTTAGLAGAPRRVPRHLNLYAFLAAVGAGAAFYFGATRSHSLALVAAVVVLYLGTVGVRDVLVQEHRRDFAVYVSVVPVTAALAATVAYLMLHSAPAAAAVALAAAPAVQWLSAHLFLRQIVRDKRAELRRRYGLE